jgi:polysaccharide biosynthesis transport protein
MPENSDNLNVTLNRLTAIVVRRRWWLLLTFFSVFLGVFFISFILPKKYRSEATLFIEKPQVPQQYVVPNNTINTMQVIQARTHEILSRTSLLQIIKDFRLNEQGKSRQRPEELIETMRENIEVEPLTKDPERREVNAFMIAFTGNDPHAAQQVTRRLISLFIEQNLKTQADQDIGTTNFLEREVEAAGANLQKQEQLLREFKMRNLGQLPEQQQGNLQILSSLQMDLQNSQANLARARQQRTYLESMLSQYSLPTATSDGHLSFASPLDVLQAEIVRLRAERDELLSRYNARYPDVVSVNRRIEEKEAQLSKLSTTVHSRNGGKAKAATDLNDLALQPAAIQLKSQLKANTMEIDDIERDIEHLKTQITEYQQRLSIAPVREQQLADVARNYDLSKQNYADLLNKRTQSQLATDLARQQRIEQFRVIDPPSLPLKPSKPDPEKICIGGLVAGLLLGVGMAFLVEARDRSFHLEKDVRTYFAIPMVVGIPTLLTEKEEKKLAWRNIVEWSSGSVLIVLILAAQLYVHWKS